MAKTQHKKNDDFFHWNHHIFFHYFITHQKRFLMNEKPCYLSCFGLYPKPEKSMNSQPTGPPSRIMFSKTNWITLLQYILSIEKLQYCKDTRIVPHIHQQSNSEKHLLIAIFSNILQILFLASTNFLISTIKYIIFTSLLSPSIDRSPNTHLTVL